MVTIGHPGYHLMDGFYSTRRGLKEYSEAHRFNFEDFIRKECPEDGTIVDLGCGNGNFLADVKRLFPRLKVFGVDKTRYVSPLQENELITANVTRPIPGLQDNVADLVVSTTLTPWIPADALESFYIEVNRLLKPEGHGVVYPIASNTHVNLNGSSFVSDLGFERPVSLRGLQPPAFLDGVAVAAVQVLLGDSRTSRYFR